MQIKKLLCLPILVTFIFGGLLVGCGSPVEKPAPTAVPTDTPVPTKPPLPTDTLTPAPEPTIAPIVFTNITEIAGNWYRKWGGFDLILRINEDGTATSTNMVGYATLEFVDGLLHWTTPGTDECDAGTVFIYEVSGVPKDYIKLKKVDEACDTYLPGLWSSKK